MLTAAQTQAILDGCTRLRDRLLFALLLDTGVRIGEALGLRHEDVEIAERQVREDYAKPPEWATGTRALKY